MHRRPSRSRIARWAVAVLGVAMLASTALTSPALASPTHGSGTAPTDTLPPLQWIAPTKAHQTNHSRAGRMVLVYFKLAGESRLDVMKDGWPRSQRISCVTGDLLPDTQWRTHIYGQTGLRYDADTHTYAYAWQTRPAWHDTCRQFQIKLFNGEMSAIRFDFGQGDRFDAPNGMDCADIITGEGSYISEDPDTHEALPYPLVSFAVTLATASCSPTASGPVIYKLVTLASNDKGVPISFEPIAVRRFTGDGSTDTIPYVFQMKMADPPDTVCVYAEVRIGHRVIERAPDPRITCFQYTLDGGSPGRTGFD